MKKITFPGLMAMLVLLSVLLASCMSAPVTPGDGFNTLFDADVHGFTSSGGKDAEGVSKAIANYLKDNSYTIQDVESPIDFNEYIVGSGGKRQMLVTSVQKNLIGGSWTMSNGGWYDDNENISFPLFIRNDALVIGKAYYAYADLNPTVFSKKELFIDTWVNIPFDMIEFIMVVKADRTTTSLFQQQYFIIFNLSETGSAQVSPYLGKETTAIAYCVPGFKEGSANYKALKKLIPGVDFRSPEDI